MPVKKALKKETIKKEPVKKVVSKKTSISNLSVPMFDLSGKEIGSLNLPKEIFGAKINEKLLSQALRVYMNNETGHFGNTKTRGEVQGSSRKIRAQKGTGGARHGSIRAHIFVGGGVAFGPKFRKIELELPKKMKKAALISALSKKAKDKELIGISGLEKVSGKTKEISAFLKKASIKNALIIISDKNEKLQRAIKNLSNAKFLEVSQLNVLDLAKYKTVILTEGVVKKLEDKNK
jgi:large subunit ribosomal protein L4